MSFPIPSFFKIRCGIIIIAFLLFFMFIGMLKQAFAACPTASNFCNQNHCWTITSQTCSSTSSSALAACQAEAYSTTSLYENCVSATLPTHLVPTNVSGSAYYSWSNDGFVFQIHWIDSSLPSCPDSNNNGIPDACDTCPSQTGYKSDILGVVTYCGNTTTQCNGESHTEYEWGFSANNCTPAKAPDCHVTSACKRDTDGDGIADDVDPDIDGDGILNANDGDVDGDGVPNNKDVNSDKDGDGQPDPSDPCVGNPDPNCADPCVDITDGTCKDTDGDGIPDDTDPCRSNADLSCTNPCAGSSDPTCKDENGDGTPDIDDSDTNPYESEAEPYSIEEETSSEFQEALKVRFQEFLNKLKTTSLFSIPSRLNNIVPTGSGDSKIIIDGGQTYGQNEIDFSGWTQGLAALNAVVYIACYSIAIRIIILKR